MAWRNVVQISTCDIPQYIVSDPDSFVSAWRNVNTSPKYEQFITSQIDTWSGLPVHDAIDGEKMCGNDTDCIHVAQVSGNLMATLKYNGVDTSFVFTANSSNTDLAWCFIALVDEENHKGLFCVAQRYRNNNVYGYPSGAAQWSYSDTTMSQMYTILTANPYIPVIHVTSNGGGATHIAKRAGLLSSIGASNLSDILMVSGGGGGGLIIGEDTYAGKDAGGISGNGNNSANQTTGYAFGQGESADGVSGGGGGLYGGYKGGT